MLGFGGFGGVTPGLGMPPAARFFGWSAADYESTDAWERRHLLRIHEEALADRRNARRPGLYDALKAAGWAAEPRRTYLRFGGVPAGERSAKLGPSGRIQRREKGVSVFPARMTVGGHYLLDLDNRLQFTLTTLMSLSGRPAYLMRGRVCGRGGTGEPLLRDVNYAVLLPSSRLVATKTPSRIVEDWNAERRG